MTSGPAHDHLTLSTVLQLFQAQKGPNQTFTGFNPMRHQPSRYDLKAFTAAIGSASTAQKITPQYLRELAFKRDQYLAKLAA